MSEHLAVLMCPHKSVSPSAPKVPHTPGNNRSRHLSLLGVVKNRVAESDLGGAGGYVGSSSSLQFFYQELVLPEEELGHFLRFSSSAVEGTPSVDESQLSCRGCCSFALSLTNLSAILRPYSCSNDGLNLVFLDLSVKAS